MIFENLIRWLLPAHLVSAAILVGASTHQVLWSRGYFRGRFERSRTERRFVAIVAIAYTATLAIGSCLYPTYKVRVRAEYLDNFVAVKERAAIRARLRGEPDPSRARDAARPLDSVARVFDIKEHAVALGWAASIGLLILSRFAHPSAVSGSLSLYLGLTWFVGVTTWLGAIIGVVTVSYQAIGNTG